MIIGLFGGALSGFLSPRLYTAGTSIFFPSVQPQLYLNLTQALRADPLTIPERSSLVDGDGRVVEVASLVLKSEAAAVYVLEHRGLSTGRTRYRDPISRFESSLKVTSSGRSTLRVEFTDRNSEDARSSLSAILDYYTGFVSKNPLSRLRSTRDLLDQRLIKQSKYLQDLEQKMLQSGSKELRNLGDSALRADPKVLRMLWMKRLDEEMQGRDLLDKLQRVRTEKKPARNPQSQWMDEWAGNLKANPKLPLAIRPTVRRQDLPRQARLEREYYEALLVHRSLVLQQSFLKTWENLENYDFDTIDPVNIREVSSPLGWRCGLGLLCGLLAGLILESTLLLIRSFGSREP